VLNSLSKDSWMCSYLFFYYKNTWKNEFIKYS